MCFISSPPRTLRPHQTQPTPTSPPRWDRTRSGWHDGPCAQRPPPPRGPGLPVPARRRSCCLQVRCQQGEQAVLELSPIHVSVLKPPSSLPDGLGEYTL